ncbi:MAG: hypothetical protein PHP28_03235 [Actinomycetota bacterium]|nr:hypothetical protein [Actinomycetota bacterium]MDD5666992.1 hypothetical protein [Actinomycetota bacterium]
MNRKRLAVLLSLLAVLASSLVLGGCGGKQDPQEAFAAATHAAREAGSAHAQINVVLSPREGETGTELNLQGDAWMDMDAGTLEARFTVMGMELSVRYVDDTAYVQFGGKWYVVQGEMLDGAGEGVIGSFVAVLSSLPEIISSTLELNELGEKKVGDRDCVLLEVVPDLRAISAMDPVREVAAQLEMSQGELREYLEEADVAIEVCVQKDEAVVRQVFMAASVELPTLSDIVGIPLLPEMARVEITMDFPEYGMEVDVRAPADAVPFEGL